VAVPQAEDARPWLPKLEPRSDELPPEDPEKDPPLKKLVDKGNEGAGQVDTG